MASASRQVQGRAAKGGSGADVRHLALDALQQQPHHLRVAPPSSLVERCLVILVLSWDVRFLALHTPQQQLHNLLPAKQGRPVQRRPATTVPCIDILRLVPSGALQQQPHHPSVALLGAVQHHHAKQGAVGVDPHCPLSNTLQ